MQDMKLIRHLSAILQDQQYVIFNTELSMNGHIPIMFYTPHVAYNFIPTQAQLKIVFDKEYKVACINSKNLPEYVRGDKRITIIDPLN